jgi:5,10-methylenetetrahydrofolate reductase
MTRTCGRSLTASRISPDLSEFRYLKTRNQAEVPHVACRDFESQSEGRRADQEIAQSHGHTLGLKAAGNPPGSKSNSQADRLNRDLVQ